MPKINHDLPINGTIDAVFDAVSTAEGFEKWWSDGGTGIREVGGIYRFDFGPGYCWSGTVEKLIPRRLFVLRMNESDADWKDTLVEFRVRSFGEAVELSFEHSGWPKRNDHFRSSNYCWAMYLRCLKLYIEEGIILDYGRRLDGK